MERAAWEHGHSGRQQTAPHPNLPTNQTPVAYTSALDVAMAITLENNAT
jgi:hypothetical protein